jgi:hypothetical protein
VSINPSTGFAYEHEHATYEPLLVEFNHSNTIADTMRSFAPKDKHKLLIIFVIQTMSRASRKIADKVEVEIGSDTESLHSVSEFFMSNTPSQGRPLVTTSAAHVEPSTTQLLVPEGATTTRELSPKRKRTATTEVVISERRLRSSRLRSYEGSESS